MFFMLPAQASLKLLMAHNPACGICQKFIKEVAVDYNDSKIAEKLPLVIISVREQPEWFKQAYRENRIKVIRGTPTFIIWNGRKELGRIIGYHSKDRFYDRLLSFFPRDYLESSLILEEQ